MSEPASEIAVPGPVPGESPSGGVPKVPGLRPEAARLLANAGYPSWESASALDDEALRSIGLESADIERVRAPPDGAAPAEVKAGRGGVERWMDRVRNTERPKRRPISPSPPRDSAAVLKKWVDGDDRAMEAWIQSAEPTPSSAPAPVPLRTVPESGTPTGPVAPETPAAGAPAATAATAGVLQREETVVRWLTDLLDRVKSDQFDPATMLQEVQELHRTLFEEQAKRRQLEEELEHVKRGSIAVIKYVRSREAKTRDQAIQAKDAEIAELRLKVLTASGGRPPDSSGGPSSSGEGAPGTPAVALGDPAAERRLREEFQSREAQFLDRETELRRRIVQLEGELRNLRVETDASQQREELRGQSEGKLTENLTRMMAEAEARERELALRENELRTRFEEIRIGSEELERKRAPLALREQELESWETKLTQTRQELEVEERRLEAQRTEEGPSRSATEKEIHQLETLKNELVHKEAEMKAREAYLRQKVEELETLQRRGIEAEPERPAATSTGPTKVRSGVRRLDDLLFGGFPPGAQLLVSGPSHSGKEILARLFVAEGLKQSLPAVWVVTDKTYLQVREEMTQLLPSYPEFEQKGQVRYIDLYSRSLGVTQSEAGVRLLSATDKGVLDQLNQAVNNATAEFRDRSAAYRLVFESVSTLSAYLDTAALFRFLQPFSGRRKLDGASGYYLLETGMHTESDLQTLEHMADGSINLKIDNLKTFLSVKGIGEVQSRAWIGYTFSKKSFSLGSFSLDHIR